MTRNRPTPEAWLGERLGGAFRIEPASSDASFRQYHRIIQDGERTRILMDAPPDREDCRSFVRITRLLRDAGVHAPALLDADMEAGYLLLEDLGTTTYLDALGDADRVDALYADAIATLVDMQGIDVSSRSLPDYDEALLRFELHLFDEWLLGQHLGIERPAPLVCVDDLLVGNALEQPAVFVHRDYHSRNLMWLESHNPGVLDYQDAVRGPITYDLVSLLRDCYIYWPDTRIAQWIDLFRSMAGAAGIDCADTATFRRWFDLTGVQRHLKAAGIFARLNHRDGKPDYLKDIPRTLGYVRTVCGYVPELEGFGTWLEVSVWPVMRERGMVA